MTSAFRRLLAITALVLSVISVTSVSAQDWHPVGPYSGQWLLDHSNDAGKMQLQLRYRQEDWNGNSSMSFGREIMVSELQGLTAEQLNQSGNVKFAIKRDAGGFACEGYAS